MGAIGQWSLCPTQAHEILEVAIGLTQLLILHSPTGHRKLLCNWTGVVRNQREGEPQGNMAIGIAYWAVDYNR